MALPFSIENILARPTYRPIAPAVYTVFHPYLLPSRNCPVNSTVGLPPFSTTRKRRKRYRTIFNDTQIELLEELFRTTQYPDLYQRENVALKAGLQEERVEVWFKNRRARNRKLKKAAKSPLEKSDAENDAELEGSENKKENKKENEKENEKEATS